MRIGLHVGGYSLRLTEREDYPCLRWPPNSFKPFLVPPATSPDLDFEIRAVASLPEVSCDRLLFDSCHGLWKLYAAGSGYLLDAPDTQTLSPRSRALVSKDFSRAEVWTRTPSPTMRPAWTPLHIINPIVEACLLTRLARDGGVLLHAAGVVLDHGAWVFTGPSGAGKSTLSDFFAAKGATILSDERIIIRNVGGEFMVFGTPWPGTGRHARNQQASLTSLFCIRHGSDGHALRRTAPSATAAFVLQQCFLPHWDRAVVDRTLAFIIELIERTDCFELAFVKSPDVVDYLKEHCLEHPVATS